jgi:hypothetical protein
MAATKTKPAPTALVKSLPARLGNDEIELLVLELEAKKAQAKAIYAECDDIENRLIANIGPTGKVTMGDGRVARIKNNFILKNGEMVNVAWKPCGVRLYEVIAE